MILLDVNVVLAAYRADHVHHVTVRPWFDRLTASEEQFGVPDVVWVSFVRVVTSSRAFPEPTPTSDAFVFLRAVRDQPRHVVISPGEEHLALFEDLCRRFDVRGDLVSDAYLAALAIDQGCSVASLDRDFARFEDLEWVVPGASA